VSAVFNSQRLVDADEDAEGSKPAMMIPRFTRVAHPPPLADLPCEGGKCGPEFLVNPIDDAYCARCGRNMM
jgi:hypothetical protein